MGGRGSSGGARASDRLGPGEEAYVKMPPTALYKDGKTVVVKTEDGHYIYKGGFDKSDRAVDTQSAEYRRDLQSYNVHAKFNADGSVTVTKGGLFDRKRNFSTIDAFQKEANSRLDKSIAYHKQQEQLTKNGRISQIAAENLRTSVRNDTANALRKFGQYMSDSAHSSRTNAAAAQDMKARLDKVVSDAKKKVKRR